MGTGKVETWNGAVQNWSGDQKDCAIRWRTAWGRYVLRQTISSLSWFCSWKVCIARNVGSARSYLDLLRALSPRAWVARKNTSGMRRGNSLAIKDFKPLILESLSKKVLHKDRLRKFERKAWAYKQLCYGLHLNSLVLRSSDWYFLQFFEETDGINQKRTSKHWEDWTWMA